MLEIPPNHLSQLLNEGFDVTTAGSMMRTGFPLIGRLFMGLTKPKHPIPGTGDSVFGESIATFGTNAEYLCIPEDGILLSKPTNMTYEEAAAVCDGALTSLSFLKDIGEIKKGNVVISVVPNHGILV